MATKTKKGAAKAAPAPAVPMAMPADFDASDSAAALLDRADLLTSVEGRESHEVIDAVLAALSESERAAVVAFARRISWLTEHVRDGKRIQPIVPAAELVPPACLAAGVSVFETPVRLRDDVASVAAIRNWAKDGVVGDDSAEAPGPADAGGQLALVAEDTPAPKKITELAFTSGDEVASVALALSGRAEDLDKEAKKLTELGRHAEAKALQREARHIKDALLAQLQPQTVLPFNAGESPLAAVTRVVGTTVRTAVVKALKNHVEVGEGETYDEVVERRLAELADFERLVGGIAEHAAAAVLPVLRETAERAFEAGLAARGATPEVLVREAVQAHGAQRAAA
ncbi:MAG: hypothetical protein K2R93_12570 [Gemmatimonadaceae bacterium]|nr:hypothetical protein [Gemmatimonadaceae bacterium]